MGAYFAELALKSRKMKLQPFKKDKTENPKFKIKIIYFLHGFFQAMHFVGSFCSIRE